MESREENGHDAHRTARSSGVPSTPSLDDSAANAIGAMRMPDFGYPWTGACSPHAATIESRMRKWAEHGGLIYDEHGRDHLARGKFAWLPARAHPHANIERLQILANYYVWYHLVDDYHVDHAKTDALQAIAGLTALLDVLDLDRIGPRPVYGETAWAELCQQLKRHMPADQFERFTHGMRMWIGASALQLLEQNQPRSIDLHQYETIRRHGSGVFAAFDLILFAHDIPLSPDEYHRPDMRELRLHGNNIVSWSNDVHSFVQELRESKQHKNMVVMYCHQGHSLQASIDLTAERVRAEIQAFVQTAASARRHASSALLDYIDGIELWLTGYQTWIDKDTRRHGSKLARPAVAMPAY